LIQPLKPAGGIAFGDVLGGEFSCARAVGHSLNNMITCAVGGTTLASKSHAFA
jgi:hypothetical protein